MSNINQYQNSFETEVKVLSTLDYQERQAQWIGQIELRNRLLSA